VKLLTIYGSVDDCEKGAPALKTYEISKVELCSNIDLFYSLFVTAHGGHDLIGLAFIYPALPT